jgi:hypothetical protein
MKATWEFDGLVDLRDRVQTVEKVEKVDAIVLERVRMILLQRAKRKRKLQPL